MYIQSFEALWPWSRSGPTAFRSQLASRPRWVPVYNVCQSHSSLLLRTAIMVLMSYLKNNTCDRETMQYLEQFYGEAQNSIAADSVLEIVYASYIMAVYSLVAGDSLKTAFVYCLQFCRSLAVLVTNSSMVGPQELSWIEMLWQEMMSSLYYIHRDSLFHGVGPRARLEESLGYLRQILALSSYLLPSEEEITKLPLSMSTEVICQKIVSLSIYMQLYLDYFLFRKNCIDGGFGSADDEIIVRAELMDILEKIVQLIPHLSNIPDYIHHAYLIPSDLTAGSAANDFLHFPNIQPRGLKSAARAGERDIALALLYAFARLLKNMLDINIDANEEASTDIDQSSIALCRLCASFPRHSLEGPMARLLIKRSLFWAGLILTESKFAAGTVSSENCFDDYSPLMDRKRDCINV